MRIDFAYKTLRRIAHPDIHNVGADVLLTDRGERMAQAVSRFSREQIFHYIVDFQAVQIGGERFVPFNQFLRLFRHGDFFVLDFFVFAFSVARDEKIAFAMSFFVDFAGAYSVTGKSTKKHKNRCVNIYFNKKT